MPDQSVSRDPALYRDQASLSRAAGDALAELANLIAAQVLANAAQNPAVIDIAPLLQVATGYFMKGELETSERWYRLVLELKTDCADAWLNLAAICGRRGDTSTEAAYRAEAFRLQRVFIETHGTPQVRVLILYAGSGAGNVPVETLMVPPVCGRIKYVIDHATEAEDVLLPDYDLVFNAIGDADAMLSVQARLERFCKKTPRPVLNAPEAVARTQRQRLAYTLAGIASCEVPPCLRYAMASAGESSLPEHLSVMQMSLPVLVRRVETHGGQTVVLCDNIAMLEQAVSALDADAYLTEFVDTRSADGYYRKYRVIFIGGVPFPYHLAISSQWLVHYFTAQMTEHAWKLEEELRFLQAPRDVLGNKAWAALVEIGKRLALDYVGIDFASGADGTLCVFEANATMLVHYENESGPLRYKNPYVRDIVMAFEQLLSGRAGAQS